MQVALPGRLVKPRPSAVLSYAMVEKNTERKTCKHHVLRKMFSATPEIPHTGYRPTTLAVRFQSAPTSGAVSACEQNHGPMREDMSGWNALRLALSMHNSVVLAASRVCSEERPESNPSRRNRSSSVDCQLGTLKTHAVNKLLHERHRERSPCQRRTHTH